MNAFVSKYFIKKVTRQNMYTSGKIQSFTRTNPSIVFVKKGRAEFFYQGRTIQVNADDLVYISMDTQYYSVWYGSPDIEFYVIHFAFLSPYQFYEYKFQTVSGFDSDCFEKMLSLYSKAPFLSVSLFYTLLDKVYSILSADALKASHINIQPAVEYIEKNYTRSIKIATLTELCNCSESALFKAFEAMLRVSPISYKHNIMIQHALDLLSHTDFSIEEISRRTGFSSSNYFRKIFIKIVGKTPSEIRKS